MTGDFLIVVADDIGTDRFAEIRRRMTDFTTAFERQRVLVLISPGQAKIDLDTDGVVLGIVFDRGGRRIQSLPADIGRDIAARAGQWLLDHAFGGYVALAITGESQVISLLRDPSGAEPAYFARSEGAWWIFSRLEIALAAGFPRPHLDWQAIGQMLAYPQLRGVPTGLRNVAELVAGSRLTLEPNGGHRIEMAWSPWTFTHREAQFQNYEAATLAVAQAVKLSVDAWARVSGRIVLALSGGLDSSIIACALDTEANAKLINFHTATPDGDERDYANSVAARVQRPLQTVPPASYTVDPGRARSGAHPRPAAQILLQPVDAAFREVGEAAGVETFFSGLGGDNVFCAVATAAPAADALLTFGPGRRALQAFDDLCRRHGATSWDALRLMLRKVSRPAPNLGLRPVLEFLTPQAITLPPTHPWLKAPTDSLPGRREHVAGILVAQSFLDRYAHADLAPVRFPLLAQPVMEACLRTPSWMWIDGGRNRAVARDAFRDRLPAQIYHRQTKGGLNAFMGEVVSAHRAALKAQLERGWLATAGLIDGRGVAKALTEPKLSASQMNRILHLADAEAWARTWPVTLTALPEP